jgi:outer membrane protein OmpA-like peptidoglycan-associated protein
MGYCGNEEMLAETEPVTSANWEKFNFKFTPKSNLDYFMIEVFYKVPTLFPYNGNILMDNASEITPIIQKEEPKVTKVEPTKPKPSTPTAKPQPSTPTAKPPVIAITRPLNKTSVTTPSVELRATTTNIGEKSQISLTVNGQAVTNFDFDKNIRLIRANVNLEEGENVFAISATTKDGSYSTSSSVNYVKQVKAVTPEEKPVVGSIIKIEKLQFAPNSAIIEKESYSSLDGIYQFLASNDNMVVEIGGHTNLIVTGDMSIRLSTDRARAVAEYLINKGIEKKRLIVKGYGNSFPVEQGTSAAANKANQRVEIKILSING